MDRRLYAVISILLGVGLGIIGDLFFYRRLIGLSVPLYVLFCTAALFGFAAVTRKRARFRNLWLLVPMGFFAVMIAVRADVTLTFINVMTVMALAALVLHYFQLKTAIDSEALIVQVMAIIETTFTTTFSPIAQIINSIGWIRERRPLHNPVMGAVLRGLMIAVPVLVVFGALLASADQVFADYLSRITALFNLQRMDNIVTHGMIVGFFTWLTCGGLAYALLRHVEADRRYVQVGDQPAVEIAPDENADTQTAAGLPQTPKGKKRLFTLGVIEAGIVLGLVDLLFGVFVVIQFAYFFGGEGNISAAGFTYSEYARRGFFELVAVSVLTLGLMLWLDFVTVRHSRAQHAIFRVLAVGMISLVGVMLWSAHVRLTLYEEAYGFTHLRLYPHVFTLWLAVLFGFFVLTLFRVRANIFSFGTLVCVIGYLVTLNLMNLDQTIMQENITRYQRGYTLDIGYLRRVSVDAVPVMLEFYQQTENVELKVGVGQWLALQQLTLDGQRADWSLLSAHASRDAAWALLDGARGQLPEYDPTYSLPYDSRD